MSAPPQEQADSDDRDRVVDDSSNIIIQKFRKQLDEEYAALTKQETMLQLVLHQLEYEEDCLKKGIEAATRPATTKTPSTGNIISTGRRRHRFQPYAAMQEPTPTTTTTTTTTTKQKSRAVQEQADARLEQALRMQLGDYSSSSSSSSEDDSDDDHEAMYG